MRRAAGSILLLRLLAFCVVNSSSESGGNEIADSAKSSDANRGKLPKMIDLGSKSCIPCKRMAPILEELREKYDGKAEIVFIDIKEDRNAAARYKITLIPTQVFIDSTGAEVYRHIGFFPADSIEAHLKAIGAKL